MPMRGRERKLTKAALRGCYEALAGLEVDGEAEGGAWGELTPPMRGVAASISSLSRALRAMLEAQIAVLEALSSEQGAEEEVSEPAPERPPRPEPRADPPPRPKPPAASPASADAAAPPGGPGTASVASTREALEAFELADLNRWLGAGTGTVFQIRGALAFLNMNAMGGRIDEMRANIKKLGFSEELGKLETDGLVGAVLLLKRPSE